MRIALVLAALFAASAGSAPGGGEPPELRPFAFLLGEWRASGSGAPGAATGTTTFSRGLQDRVMLRTSFAEYPARAGSPASRHDDLMVIYVDPAGVRAAYYDSEGHVILYAVESPAPGRAVFVSEGTPSAPGFRLSYQLASDGGLDGMFEIAPPGESRGFETYLSWHATRVGSATP